MSPEDTGWALPGPADGSAGASAAAHHRALASGGAVGGDDCALAQWVGPVRTESRRARNWAQGAAGERLTAQVLAPLAHLGWAVLHDRRLPGGANLDHLVIGPGGVWVVDSKAYRGRIKVLGDQRLWYGRTCLDEVLRVVRWAADRVAAMLGVPVASALCVHGARLPRDPLAWDGVVLAGPATLLPLLARAAGASPAEPVAALSARAEAAFPAAHLNRQGAGQ